MKFDLRRVAAAAVLVTSSVGCSSGGGFLGTNLPSGNIVVTDALTGQVITSSLANPYIVPLASLGFAISVSEDRFGGPYNVSIIDHGSVPTASNNNSVYPFVFNIPCFVIHNNLVSNTKGNVLSFSGDNAVSGKPLSFPDAPFLTATEISAGGSPCHSGEREVAAISDGKGHIANFYYEEQ